MRKHWFLFFLFPAFLIANEPLARKVLAIYDSKQEGPIETTFAHLICEFPLNHIGINLIYHDLQKPLPDLSTRPDILGVLTCFPHEMRMEDPEGYLLWAESVIDAGKKYVFLLDPGFKKNIAGEYTALHLINNFYEKLGLVDLGDWKIHTFQYNITTQDKKLTEFEHPYSTPLPPFGQIESSKKDALSYLSVEIEGKPETKSDLIIISPQGGYVSEYWATSYIKDEQAPEARFWYINPFLFFRLAFGLQKLPAPDITTLAGRRIYYSQIDGDALISVTDIEKYRKSRMLCGEVILKEILEPNPDLPVTVSFIGADIDKEWVGTKKSQEITRKIALLPWIELGSHTYSHPFEWVWFKTHHPKEEIDFFHLYPYGNWQSSYLSWLRAVYYSKIGKTSMHETGTGIGFVVPRAYANKPFNLELEIEGSCKKINSFAPKDKKVTVLQWSGDCYPWDTPIAMTRSLKIRNINGGDSIKDNENPSYTTVAPFGRHVGEQIQIYASNANENLYTYEWTSRFYGFQFVVETFKNTELPIRVSPIDLYYHFYSGEKLAALNAVKKNIEYIRTQKLILLWTSRYCEVADGFYTTMITPLGENKWQFSNLQGLGTIRFDSTFIGQGVDFTASTGVIGQTHHQGSLYVYLDKTEKNPIIALNDKQIQTPFLIDSSWEIWDYKKDKHTLTFTAQGFGPLEMHWQMKQAGDYLLEINGKTITATTNNKNKCHFLIDLPFNETIQATIVQKG